MYVDELGGVGRAVQFCHRHRHEYLRLVARQRKEFGGLIIETKRGDFFPLWKVKDRAAGRFYYASKRGFHGY